MKIEKMNEEVGKRMRELAEMMNRTKKGMTDDHEVDSDNALKAWRNKLKGMTRNDGTINLTAQERIRADEAVRFHKISGHMGTLVMYEALDHGLFNTHLISRDMKNTEAMMGNCMGCIEGKMRAD